MEAEIQKHPRRWLWRMVKGVIGLVIIVILLIATARWSIGWVIGRTLQSQLSTRMQGSLQFKRVIYQFPYGLRIDDAHLSLAGGNGEVDVGRLRLKLAKLPIGHGPLLIESLEIQNPTVRLAPLLKTNTGTPEISAPPEKLSDLFRLKSVSLTGGRFEYDWKPTGHPRPPMVWDHLDAAISTTSAVAGKYAFSLSINDKPLVTAKADGSFDIDSLDLHVDHMTVAAACDAKQPAQQIPPMVLAAMQKIKIGGQLTVTGWARVPLRKLQQSQFAAEVSLRNGRCKPPGFDQMIEPILFSFSCSNITGAESLRVESLQADYGMQHLSLTDGGELTYDPSDELWTIRNMQGSGEVGDGVDPLLGNSVKLQVPFTAAGSGKWGDTTAGVRFVVDHAAARVTPNSVLIDQIKGMLTLTLFGLTSTQLTGDCAGGRVRMAGVLNWKDLAEGTSDALAYHGQLNISQLDVHQLAMQYAKNSAVAPQSVGKLDLNMKYWTQQPTDSWPGIADSAADYLRARGDVDINHGYFLEIPVLKEVLRAMDDPAASVLGEAASTFDVEKQSIKFKRVAVSSPAIGIQGGGTLGFDQKLNMVFVATPLADWSRDFNKSRLRVLRRLAGIAGAVQRLFNKAQSIALYQFRVTGNVSKPEVKAVPVPILSDGVERLFETMSGNHAEGSMSNELKKE